MLRLCLVYELCLVHGCYIRRIFAHTEDELALLLSWNKGYLCFCVLHRAVLCVWHAVQLVSVCPHKQGLYFLSQVTGFSFVTCRRVKINANLWFCWCWEGHCFYVGTLLELVALPKSHTPPVQPHPNLAPGSPTIWGKNTQKPRVTFELVPIEAPAMLEYICHITVLFSIFYFPVFICMTLSNLDQVITNVIHMYPVYSPFFSLLHFSLLPFFSNHSPLFCRPPPHTLPDFLLSAKQKQYHSKLFEFSCMLDIHRKHPWSQHVSP